MGKSKRLNEMEVLEEINNTLNSIKYIEHYMKKDVMMQTAVF